jgi:hypothetical protein
MASEPLAQNHKHKKINQANQYENHQSIIRLTHKEQPPVEKVAWKQ